MKSISRRTLMARTGQAAIGALGLPLLSEGAGEAQRPRLKIVVAGAHPDDPESSAGGTMARYADLGHEVVALYLTRGEAGIRGKSHAEAARIRTAEAEKACAILKARAVFAGQIDGSSEVTTGNLPAIWENPGRRKARPGVCALARGYTPRPSRDVAAGLRRVAGDETRV